MNEITVLSWQNETSLSPFPLSKSFGMDNLLIDAHFVQFDNFIPVVKTIFFDSVSVNLEIQFDRVLKTVEVLFTNFNGLPYTHKIVEGGRYLGKLVFGPDANVICYKNQNSVVTVDTKFLPFLVKSVPSNCGVYKIDELYGALQFTSDENISYNVSGQNITFNAVATLPVVDEPYLKTLNQVAPTQNSVYIQDSIIIKVAPFGPSVVFSLVGTGVNNLVADQNNTITTNPNP